MKESKNLTAPGASSSLVFIAVALMALLGFPASSDALGTTSVSLCPSPTSVSGFIFFPLLDSQAPNSVNFQTPLSTIQSMAELCKSTAACRGFNTNGVLKSSIVSNAADLAFLTVNSNSTPGSTCAGLYVRLIQGNPFNCSQGTAVSGYTFLPFLSTGEYTGLNDVGRASGTKRSDFAAQCNSLAGCVGFDSSGNLKGNSGFVTKPFPNSCSGLYLRNGADVSGITFLFKGLGRRARRLLSSTPTSIKG